MSNIKDTITNICGVVFVIAGAVAAVATAGVALPVWLTAGATTAAAVSAAIIGYFTGKAPNGTAKTPAQIAAAKAEQPPTK